MTWPRPPQVGQLIAARAGFGAAAVASIAGVELAHFDFFFHAEGRFLERDLHVVTQIGAALAIFARCLAPPPKKVSKFRQPAAENFAKNIERIVKAAARPRRRPGQTRRDR